MPSEARQEFDDLSERQVVEVPHLASGPQREAFDDAVGVGGAELVSSGQLDGDVVPFDDLAADDGGDGEDRHLPTDRSKLTVASCASGVAAQETLSASEEASRSTPRASRGPVRPQAQWSSHSMVTRSALAKPPSTSRPSGRRRPAARSGCRGGAVTRG